MSFGADPVPDEPNHPPTDLQLEKGKGFKVKLSWQVRNADQVKVMTRGSDGAGESSVVDTVSASAGGYTADPGDNDTQYGITAMQGDKATLSGTWISVQFHDALNPTSPAAHVDLPPVTPPPLEKEKEAPEPMEYILGSISQELLSKEFPEDAVGAHFIVGVALKAEFEVVFKGAEAEKPAFETAKQEVSKHLLDYFTANVESPLISAIKNPDIHLSASGVSEAKLLEQSRSEGKKSYTFGELKLFEVKLATPGVDTGVVTFEMTAAVAEVNLEGKDALESGLGVLTGAAKLTLIDASAGVKDIGIGHGLEVKGELAVELEAKLIAVTVVDLLQRAGITIAEDLLIDSGVTFLEGLATEVTVDGAIAAGSVAAGVAVIIITAYEVGKSFSELAQANKDNDLGIKVKYTPSYVPGLVQEARESVNTGAGLGLLGGAMPVGAESLMQGNKVALKVRAQMHDALQRRNSNIDATKFENMFGTYMAQHKDDILKGMDKPLQEIAEVYAWSDLFKAGLPLWLQFDNLDTPPVRSVWAVAWEEIFGDNVDILFNGMAESEWDKDSNVLLTGKVAGIDKWKMLRDCYKKKTSES